MWHLLKRHPFPVVANFERVVAVSFAFPENALRPMVSKGLVPDTYEGFGFITVALVWTRNLRPNVFPEFLGRDFFLAGYRIFTRLTDSSSGRRLRGLQILRSETDDPRMVCLGNWMTHYRYCKVRTEVSQMGSSTRVVNVSRKGDVTLDLTFDVGSAPESPPQGSPFRDWKTARRFSGPMPFTFSQEGRGKYVVIEGSRNQWTPRPLEVKYWKMGLFEETPLRGIPPLLANAFIVENVDYRWERGRLVNAGGGDE
ncbi:MAG: DUF2071 domain-containing protein [Luteolibacter sp.]